MLNSIYNRKVTRGTLNKMNSNGFNLLSTLVEYTTLFIICFHESSHHPFSWLYWKYQQQLNRKCIKSVIYNNVHKESLSTKMSVRVDNFFYSEGHSSLLL